MRISTKLLSLAASALLCFTSHEAKADHDSPMIRILGEHYPPFQFQTAQGISGFASEIISTALDQAELSYQMHIITWPRAYELAQKRENTCIYSIARTADREEYFQWSPTISITKLSFIGLAEKNIQISSIDDAKQYKIAVVKHDLSHQTLLKQGFEEGKNLIVMQHTDSLLSLLKMRKGIDLVIADELSLFYRANQSGISFNQYKNYFDFSSPLSFHLACSNKTDKTLFDNIYTAIEAFKKTEHYQFIIDKWSPNYKIND